MHSYSRFTGSRSRERADANPAAARSPNRSDLGLSSLFLAVALGAAGGHAAGNTLARKDFPELTLEQLSGIVVTSVSKRAEKLSTAAASVFVIGADDIRRSGATTLPEALRLAPNLDVARADANQYAVSARGFNSITSNRMLVLIDGRAVYSPLFSGVFWDAQEVMLEDVERIEVISGPGTTLWGANAVNGVINVITRGAQETQGMLATAGGGTQESNAAARYGGTLGERGHYRLYAQYRDRSNTSRENGPAIRDASTRAQAGFRADWVEPGHALTLQGDAYRSSLDQAPAARGISGSNLIGRWNQLLGDGSRLRAQVYFDRTDRRVPLTYDDSLQTVDVDLQYALKPGNVHTVLAGGGYRSSHDRFEGGLQQILPADKDLVLSNLYVQDTIALRPDLEVTLGGKFERNSYSGGEFLPSARVSWRPLLEAGEDLLLWSSLSRSLRTPSRTDRDFYSAAIVGGSDFQSEVSTVFEAGIRAQPTPAFAYSLTAFRHVHTKLRSAEPMAGRLVFDNLNEGTSTGLEAWGTYHVSKTWRMTAGAVVLHQDLRPGPGSLDTGAGVALLGNDPKVWSSLRSSWDLSPRHELDLNLRHVASRPNPQVPGYVTLDARVGWQVSNEVEVSLVLQNLLDAKHVEWGVSTNRAEYERGAFLKVVWRP